MTMAFLFPGQGEESAGMSSHYLTSPGPVQRLLARASRQLQLELTPIIKSGAPALMRTEVIQPTLVAITTGLALELISSGITPSAVAGHSLGELSAAAVAGCIEPEAAVDLAVQRGVLMGEVARRTPGGMLALTTEDPNELEQALAVGRRAGCVDLAAQNSPSQWVLSGEKAALEAISAKYKTTRLPVSGAWHSALMKEAEQAWRETLRALPWKAPKIHWLCNRSGRWVRDDDDLPSLLAGQLTRPIQWASTMRSLEEAKIKRLILVGPSRALRGLCRANLEQAEIETATGRQPLEREVKQ